jgi:hypothetical protein
MSGELVDRACSGMVSTSLGGTNVAKGMDLNGLQTVVDVAGMDARPLQEGEGIPVYAEDFQFNVKNKSQKSVN